TAALEHFWTDDELTRSTATKSDKVRAGLQSIMEGHPGLFTDVRGRGLILGIETAVPEIASTIAKGAYERGLIIETAGAEDEVVKLLPPLIVTDEAIDTALEILNEAADTISDDMVAQLSAEREEVRS